jgi:hypothetical protein
MKSAQVAYLEEATSGLLRSHYPLYCLVVLKLGMIPGRPGARSHAVGS